MDKVIERLERLEAQCVVLSEENGANKVTIKVLQKKLLENEKQIQKLTNERQMPSSEIAGDSKNNKRFQVLEKQIVKLQQQIQDVNDKFGKVDKLQHLFSSAILKKATVHDKMEQLSSRLDSVSNTVDDLQANAGLTSSQMDELTSRCTSIQKEFTDFKSSKPKTEEPQQAQAASAPSPMKSQDSQIETEFKSHMTRLWGRKVPLSWDDYKTMSALESIAGTQQGPAFQFVAKLFGNARHAEKNRQIPIKQFHGKGIKTTNAAMTKYVKLCDRHTSQCTSFSPDMQYYPIYTWSEEDCIHCGDCILAIDELYLRFLNCETKKEMWSCLFTEIDICDIDDHKVILRLPNGDTVMFFTHEKISPQVHATICSLMGK